jgi:hypothetical protein
MSFDMKSVAARMLIILSCFMPVHNASGADRFVYGFEDLPLMDALTQVAGSSVLFDTPQGRIVQASATGQVERQTVLEFYRDTLPQLGWTLSQDGIFQREGETLRLEFTETDAALEVRFLIEPTATR